MLFEATALLNLCVCVCVRVRLCVRARGHYVLNLIVEKLLVSKSGFRKGGKKDKIVQEQDNVAEKLSREVSALAVVSFRYH